MCVHCLCATHEYLTKFLEGLHQHTHANIKFKLSYTVYVSLTLSTSCSLYVYIHYDVANMYIDLFLDEHVM